MISCFDLVAILSCLAGLYILISRNTFLFSRDTKLLMITMLLISTGYSFFMLIEWMNISHKFEAYENLLGALLPMNWAFIYYSFIQHNKKEELHNHQEKLKMSEERLNLSLKGTKAGIWDWHIQTGNLVINDQWAEMIGYKPSELQPVDIHTWEKLSHPDDLKKSNEMLDLHFKGKTDFYECEARLRHKNGNWVWVLDRGMVVERDGQGCPVRMTGTHIDISKQKNTESDLKEQMEENRALSEEYLSQNEELIKSLERIRKINEELEEARKKAEESDHLKSAFLANMSHEIRTPMNGIIGFSEMIMDPTLSTEKRNYYARIVIESSRQLETIVNDILDIARIESAGPQ
jgi:PAS domain S-box-containing protein